MTSISSTIAHLHSQGFLPKPLHQVAVIGAIQALSDPSPDNLYQELRRRADKGDTLAPFCAEVAGHLEAQQAGAP